LAVDEKTRNPTKTASKTRLIIRNVGNLCRREVPETEGKGLESVSVPKIVRPQLLLVDWLNAWVFEMAVRHMLFSRFQVALADGGLHGFGWGEPLDRARHQPAVEIKGATYTELRVWAEADGTWHAQCVVDV
jgi:hypothetical protein